MGSAYGIPNCTGWYSTRDDLSGAGVGLCNTVYSDAGATQATNGQAAQQWGDSSGDGNHATQTTAGQKPIFRQFGGWHPGGNQGCLSFSAAANSNLVLPSGVAVGNGSTVNEGTILLCSRGPASGGFGVSLGGFGLFNAGGNPNQLAAYNGSTRVFAGAVLLPTMHPIAWGMRFKAGESKLYVGTNYSDVQSTNWVNQTFSGGLIGGLTPTGFNADADYFELMVFNVALSDSNAAYLLKLMQDRVCGEFDNQFQVVFGGDSRTFGYNGNVGGSFPYYRSYPYRLARNLGGHAKFYSDAHTGDTITQCKTRLTNQRAVANSHYAKNVYIVEIGVNDIANGSSAATIEAALTDLWQTALANYSHVIALTIAPTASLSSPKESIRQTVNTWIKQQSMTGLYVCDNAADTRLLLTGYPDPDGTHWLDPGISVYAQNVGRTLKRVLTPAAANRGYTDIL